MLAYLLLLLSLSSFAFCEEETRFSLLGCKWGITYLVCMIYEIIGELTRLLLTLTIVFTMMRMKERKDEMEKHLWPNSLNSDNVTSSAADSILIQDQVYCKMKTVHCLQRIVHYLLDPSKLIK